MLKWICDPIPGLYAGPCTPETGGKPGTMHKRCGYYYVIELGEIL